MKSTYTKPYGIALIAGCLFMVVTMVLHPVGGSFEHLVSIITIGRVSHIIAIISLPLVAYGFWGLARLLDHPLANLSYFFMIFGLVAVMFAGAVNGLILMDFVERYRDASDETITSLKPFFRLIQSFNHAFDFIFIGAVCISTGLWSLVMLIMKSLPKLLGWMGIAITIAALVSLLAGVVFVDLQGFRVFIFGWVIWVTATGLVLIRK